MDDTRSPLRLTGEIRNSVLTSYHPKHGDLLRVEEVGERGEISVMPVSESETIAALRRELAGCCNDLYLERMTRHVSEYVERAIDHGGYRYTIGELRRMAEMSPDSDAARIIEDLIATRDRLAAFAEMEHTADEALKAAHLARETLRAELDAARRELAASRAEINDILPELDAVRSMGTQLERELAARTEERDQWRREATARGAATIKAEGERDAARKALWLTWLNGHDFNFNEQDKKMINAQLDLAAESSK